ncbi:MAG: EscU/YscU/HrcU family type III secretion system export apparatus switch protein [Myxococcota bacterium]
MADEDAGDRKHDPGEKKWREAAEKGQMPRSADVNAAAVVISAAAAWVLFPGPVHDAFVRASVTWFDGKGPYNLTLTGAHGLLNEALVLLALSISVPLAASLVASTLASIAQSRLQLAPKALEPKWERLDVVSGFQQTYLSWTPLLELAKGVAKILVIGATVLLALWPKIAALPRAATLTVGQLLQLLVDLGWSAVLAAAPIIIVIAAIDYAASYQRTLEQLKRTDRELRDDQKEQEGDPRFKAFRRQRARKIALAISLNAVRDADVVVTNPTHLAVALKYDRAHDEAPKVLCKGADHLAARIRSEARKAAVPRIQNRPLARALYKRCEVGDAVPTDLFVPVAKVLAVVFRRRQQRNTTRTE